MSIVLTRIYLYNTTTMTINASGSDITSTNVAPTYYGNNWLSDLSTNSPDNRPDGANLLNAFTKDGYFTDDTIGINVVQFSSGTNINVGTGFTVYASAGATNSIRIYVGGVLKATLTGGQTYTASGSQATGAVKLVPYAGSYPGYTGNYPDATNFLGYVKIVYATYTSGSDLDTNNCVVYFVPRPVFSISTVSTKTPTYSSATYSNAIVDSNNQFVKQFVFSAETMSGGSQTFPVVFLNGISGLTFSTIYDNPNYDADSNDYIANTYIPSYCRGNLISFTSYPGYSDNGSTFVPASSNSNVAWGSTQSVNLTFSQTSLGTFTQTVTYITNRGIDGLNVSTVKLAMSAMVTSRLFSSTTQVKQGSANAQSVTDGTVTGSVTWVKLGDINASGVFTVTATGGSTVDLTGSTLSALFANTAMLVISNTVGSSLNVQYIPVTVSGSNIVKSSATTTAIADGTGRLFVKTMFSAQNGGSGDIWAVSTAVSNS